MGVGLVLADSHRGQAIFQLAQCGHTWQKTKNTIHLVVYDRILAYIQERLYLKCCCNLKELEPQQ